MLYCFCFKSEQKSYSKMFACAIQPSGDKTRVLTPAAKGQQEDMPNIKCISEMPAKDDVVI